MTNNTATKTRSGDRCVLLGGGLVQHYDCDQHADGTVTDVWNGGRVVSTRASGALR